MDKATLKRKLWLGAALFAVLFVSLGFRLHGYSLMAWRNIIDGSPAKEIWWGQAQSIRSDDFLVALPWALSQSAQNPSFSRMNPSIGYGQDMIALGVPKIHWTALFRPTSWGFFLGDDFGLAWNWTFRWLFQLFVLFLLFEILTRRDFWLSLLCSLTLLVSPFFAFWSYGPGHLTTTSALALYGALRTVSAETRREATLFGLLSAWSGVSFFF
ncbi:MAG TPA: hypothetical protein VFW62_09050, partial [bacterium]|nr:hypothetical protein [bacterium]